MTGEERRPSHQSSEITKCSAPPLSLTVSWLWLWWLLGQHWLHLWQSPPLREKKQQQQQQQQPAGAAAGGVRRTTTGLAGAPAETGPGWSWEEQVDHRCQSQCWGQSQWEDGREQVAGRLVPGRTSIDFSGEVVGTSSGPQTLAATPALAAALLRPTISWLNWHWKVQICQTERGRKTLNLRWSVGYFNWCTSRVK